jgi:hypothetical protein
MKGKMQHLLYRYQFFFGKTPFKQDGWLVRSMPEGNCLSTHPDLDVTQVSANGFQVTLLGFILDPDCPEDGNAEILERLCASAGSVDQWIESTEPMGGRWLIFLYHRDTGVFFNDPAGMRTAYYYLDAEGNAWLGTQPGLFQHQFIMNISPEGASYMGSARFVEKLETWWPGKSSPFTGVYHLHPNHYFDLKAKRPARYWPVTPFKRVPLEEGVRIAAKTIKGMMASARKRFPLAVSLSSGLDSRMVFAGCRDFADDVFIFSMMYRHLTPESDDVRVPSEMARSLDLDHHIIDASVDMTSEFAEVYSANTTGIKDDWGKMVYSRYEHVPQNYVILKGTGSEIVRCRYWPLGVYPYRVTLRDLVNLAYLGNDPLVISSFREWMKEALPTEKLGYKLLDMFSWENEVGNWYALGQVVNDLSHQDFAPISNRRLINAMLGVHPKFRSYPEHVMERRITAYLWSDLAKFPYTPSRKAPRKQALEGPVLNSLRWARYLLFKKKFGRLEE